MGYIDGTVPVEQGKVMDYGGPGGGGKVRNMDGTILTAERKE